MYKVSAVFIGVLIAAMVSFNSILAGYTSSMFSVLVVHVVGLVAVGTIALIKREKVNFEGKVPIYIFCGGVVGVLLTYLNNACVGSLGVSLTLALGLLGQAGLSCFVDHFGLFGMEKYHFGRKKIVGFAVAFAGIICMIAF